MSCGGLISGVPAGTGLTTPVRAQRVGDKFFEEVVSHITQFGGSEKSLLSEGPIGSVDKLTFRVPDAQIHLAYGLDKIFSGPFFVASHRCQISEFTLGGQ
jgi:hypothetical protein